MKVSIIFGGVSYEHEVSIVSAIALLKKLRNKISVENCIFLDSNHDFYLIEKGNMTSTYFSSSGYKNAKKIQISFGGFVEKGFLGKTNPIFCGTILNLIHGGDGEDGVLASLFDFYEINFIGPRAEACYVSCNKYFTKLYAKERGVATLNFDVHSRGNTKETTLRDFPLIVKPLRLGSSIGVHVINNENEIDYALDSAFEFDDQAIIEPFIRGVKEYNLAGTKVGKEYVFSIVEEPAKKDMLDFDNKYLDFSRTEEVKEAEISKHLKLALQNEFKKIYEDQFEGALIRCDFFVIDDKIYLNEINPIPGSMANYLFDDFESILIKMQKNLPSKRNIKIDYKYIKKIHIAKGN